MHLCISWPIRRVFSSCLATSEVNVSRTASLRAVIEILLPRTDCSSAGRRTGEGKTRRATPRNGQEKPHYRLREAGAACA